MPDLTTAQLQRLTDARWQGEQALFTTAVAMLSERPALPDDLEEVVEGLLDAGFDEAADAIEALANERDGWISNAYAAWAIATSYMDDAESLLDDLGSKSSSEAVSAASEPQCAVVKPLIWKDSEPFFHDELDSVYYAEAVGAAYTYVAEALDCTIEEAKAEQEAEYESNVLSAITLRTEAEVRAEAWAAAIEAAADEAMASCHDGDYVSRAIRALTQPADIAAALDRIKAEAEAKGMRKAADICIGETLIVAPEGIGQYAALDSYRAQIRSAILAAIPEVRK